MFIRSISVIRVEMYLLCLFSDPGVVFRLFDHADIGQHTPMAETAKFSTTKFVDTHFLRCKAKFGNLAAHQILLDDLARLSDRAKERS